MRKKLWCLLVGLGMHFTLRAQQAPAYTIHAGEIVANVIPLNEQYFYSEFQQGTVWLRNGKSLPALLNYNYLYGEMQFINSKGDTLALVEENSLKNIAINEDVFYQVTKNGFAELITAHLPVKLARKQNLELIKIKVKLVGTNTSHFFSYRFLAIGKYIHKQRREKYSWPSRAPIILSIKMSGFTRLRRLLY